MGVTDFIVLMLEDTLAWLHLKSPSVALSLYSFNLPLTK